MLGGRSRRRCAQSRRSGMLGRSLRDVVLGHAGVVAMRARTGHYAYAYVETVTHARVGAAAPTLVGRVEGRPCTSLNCGAIP
jgi:hypothetical protein